MGWDLALAQGAVTVRFLTADIVKLSYVPKGGTAASPTVVIDPDAAFPALTLPPVEQQGDEQWLGSDKAHLRWQARGDQLIVEDAAQRPLLRIDVAALARGELVARHDKGDALYGIHGYGAFERADGGLRRKGRQVAKAGEQGFAGAPFVWSTAGYGVLVDAEGARFTLAGDRVSVQGKAQPIRDVYLFIGPPRSLFASLAQVSGRTPLFPKWAMGFTNSQWSIDEKELLEIVDTYRAKQIPLDNMTLDFDWKAWGEDDYGEFRWNPVKFPDGPDGKLKALLDAKGVHITGIMKPRVHLDTVEGRYATEHGFWSAASQPSPDYFSHKAVRDVDFDHPQARTWFFNDALKHSFDTGVIGWWNDEADYLGSDTQFMNMQRALYEGQRAYADQRVWSVNRNFYLGAQRYAYGLWSGDIQTGFASMKGQRQRMLSAINVGAMQWGMDGGGFKKGRTKSGAPTPENYARWIQFGAFTPIFRVHGDFDQKRQPWRYGPVAEKAAADAIRLRYALIPYIYAYEYQRRQTGVGLVRPLLFDYPDDPTLREDVDAWMFGDYLLVSPVVERGQTSKDIYLPAGSWTDYATGKVYAGGQTIRYAIDSKTWSDIPLFIRDGAIIPMQVPMNYVGERPLRDVDVEVFPAAARHVFSYYDDDGATYGYERGDYFLQTLAAQRQGDSVNFETEAATGSFRPALAYYVVKIHGTAANAISDAGHAWNQVADLDALRASVGEGWAKGSDRFGPVTWLKVAAGQPRNITLSERR
ncbi:TIM-barrel domain-containing protein [Dyella subtropica]|uniref:TIM-barrel domain-containing protein n=1 Tax=Dyella subtropica TaxID=2992127 RepID=UPI002255C263|nr:TIM-barrel domain-containing protein [Dyella subtropica]